MNNQQETGYPTAKLATPGGEGFFARLDRGFKRLEPVDWVFGLFRASAVIVVSIWAVAYPELDGSSRLILANLAFYFAVYSMALSLGGVLRPAKIGWLYQIAMVFDILFLGIIIYASGGIGSSLFYLGFYLLIPLHTFYFGSKTGGLAFGLCILAFILPNVRELGSVPFLDVALKLGVLGGIFLSNVFLRMRQDFARNRLFRLNEEVEQKNRLLAHRSVSERNRIYELYALNKVGKLIASALDTRELFSHILGAVGRELHFQHFCLWLYDEATEVLIAKAVEGISPEVIDEVTVSISNPVEGACLRDKKSILFEDISLYPDYDYLKGYLPDIQSAMCVPLIVRGRIAGVISAYSKHEESFSKERLEVLSAVAEQISIALENSRLYNQMRFLSMQDGLTQLYNRRFFDEQIEAEVKKAEDGGAPCALLIVDVDNFKKVNDELGHLVGDNALKKVARVLMGNTRQSDYVCRYGGEEFAVILHNVDLRNAINRAERLRRAIETEVSVQNADGSKRVITVSIGVASYYEGAKVFDLIDVADQGLYLAKESGRNLVKAICSE
ncbi:diguanylate cyclase [bacterium]|nr:diguanylate cyclase [bacterium]